MATREITFTIKSINKEDTNTTNMRILPLEITDNDNNKVENIARIHFVMHDAGQNSKLDILEEQETYKLSFDDGEMKINKGGNANLMSKGSSSTSSRPSAKKAGTFNMASSAELEEEPKKGPFVLVNEDQKEIRVLVYPEFNLEII